MGQRGEVVHGVGRRLFDGLEHGGTVRDVEVVVGNDDVVAALLQMPPEPPADEPRPPRYEGNHPAVSVPTASR